MNESRFQFELVRRIRKKFKGCIILKNDAGYLQGFPDISILYQGKYAALECKVRDHMQPNQKYYIDLLNNMGFYASIVMPDIEDYVINELFNYFNDLENL